MAADNKTLGRFTLSGIPPAPRGVPQIEVKFDIDANGIVHVSAKDLGTGKQQEITIKSSSGLEESEIERMVKEAERFAEEDKKRKEKVEAVNQADSLIYQSEKTLKEFGDKVKAADKEKVEQAKKSLREALNNDNLDEIKKKTEELSEALYAITTKMYQQAASQAQQAGKAEQEKEEPVVDADYKVVDEEEEPGINKNIKSVLFEKERWNKGDSIWQKGYYKYSVYRDASQEEIKAYVNWPANIPMLIPEIKLRKRS